MEQILDSNEKIENLVKLIGNIGEKTKVMDEIVFQTKLLSFNASVEAERAGEHGRGFAVVAQEVGNLAQLSGSAAKEIATIVTDSIKDADLITTDNKSKVEQGNRYVQQTADILGNIVEQAECISEKSKLVQTASKEQSTGITQINTAMAEIETGIQSSSNAAENAATSVEDLRGQVIALNTIMNDLKKVMG